MDDGSEVQGPGCHRDLEPTQRGICSPGFRLSILGFACNTAAILRDCAPGAGVPRFFFSSPALAFSLCLQAFARTRCDANIFDATSYLPLISEGCFKDIARWSTTPCFFLDPTRNRRQLTFALGDTTAKRLLAAHHQHSFAIRRASERSQYHRRGARRHPPDLQENKL